MMEKQIDYVVPMVFHDDAEWQKNFREVGWVFNEKCTSDFVRYRSWGNEHLLIKCVKRFMPWVRTIFVVLAQESQKQAWMEEEGVRIVYHHDFIPERFLPTFNSQTIEVYLKDIPELSEYFIYGNDDMFPLSPLKIEDFFVNGLPLIHYNEEPFPESPNIFHLGCRSGLNFVAQEFGKEYKKTYLKGNHGLTPMIKSTWQHLWLRGEEELMESISAFREPQNFNQWLCPWWHFLSGKYIDGGAKTTYTNTTMPLSTILDAINSENAGVVCINDNEWLKDYRLSSVAVNEAIEKKLQ